ncbi:MAG: hypothetical protein NZ895_04895 [Archaeoglobaceae archaeon]|nr:hypothetical protein [Archaeoglobaceae archaeon]MCX8152721.1 hypothetical protein [Archaeoglobaceae archaeon]MDW8013428.1 hypothetical protein [Archaeoglobaceae archaeon]
MKFKVVRIEMKEESEVTIFLKKVGSKVSTIPQPDIRNPLSFIEFGIKLSEEAVKKFESYDAIITMNFEDYAAKDLKVGDVVEVEIKISE